MNPGVSEAELGRFGDISWERPFGHIVGDVDDSALTRIYSGYGDMFPFGDGESFCRYHCVRCWFLQSDSVAILDSCFSLSFSSFAQIERSGSHQNFRRRWIHHVYSSGVP